MNKSVRKAVIAGNWKMNKTRPEAKALLEELKPLVVLRTRHIHPIRRRRQRFLQQTLICKLISKYLQLPTTNYQLPTTN